MKHVLPWFAALASVFTAIGVTGLGWYWCLSREDREKADQLTLDHAMSFYGKGLKELTKQQLAHVHELTRMNFPS